MHDMQFERQQALENTDLMSYAEYLRLDLPRFVADLADGTYEMKVRSDFMSGVRSGVNGTPTFSSTASGTTVHGTPNTLTEACLATLAAHV